MSQGALAATAPYERSSTSGWLRWAPLAVLAALAAIALGAGLDRWRGASSRGPLDPALLHAGYGASNFAAVRERSEQVVYSARQSVARYPGEWLREEGLARALMGRWRLTGNYADLAEADRLLDTALARTPDPAGPVLTRALLSIDVHRLEEAERALARFRRSVVPDDGDRADAEALTGDIAMQRGELDEAARHFARAAQIAGTPGIGLRGALLASRRGDNLSAKRALEALLAKPRQPPALLAELALQRANIAYAEGDWDGATSWVAAARRVFKGYWLADAYAAQNEAIAGHSSAAIAKYEELARRTSRPEVMDALAHLLRLQGQPIESKAWAARAAAGWRANAALFPEAVAQHYAEHELAVGSAARALTLAQVDVAGRPQWPGIALLGRALVLEGRPREALAQIALAERQGWRSAGLFMLKADAQTALGDQAGADASRARALAINPRAADPRIRLIWFGHD
jgi:tetratricopeptide (TPR) repeat protein